eukprot:scaffold8620_cov62-Phaeocystis_antarctica.AAC.13
MVVRALHGIIQRAEACGVEDPNPNPNPYPNQVRALHGIIQWAETSGVDGVALCGKEGCEARGVAPPRGRPHIARRPPARRVLAALICCLRLRCLRLCGRALATVPDQLRSPLRTLFVAGQPFSVHALQAVVASQLTGQAIATGRLTVSGEAAATLDDSRRAASRLALRAPLGHGARECGRVLRLHAGEELGVALAGRCHNTGR